MIAAVAIVAVSSILFEWFLRTRVRAQGVVNFPFRRSFLTAGGVISALAVILPLVSPDDVVPAARMLGPLAMTAIVLIVLLSLLIFLSYLSKLARWPVAGTVMFAALLWSGVLVYKALRPDSQTPAGELPSVAQAQNRGELHDKFNAWWQARKDDHDRNYVRSGRKYPVFIIAAEGGGIYATSAAASFLTEMQDACPSFAQHVFSISAVSGGAIGSALFAALNAGQELESQSKCTEIGAQVSHDQLNQARNAVRNDHLSPALAMIWPDIARKFLSPLLSMILPSNVQTFVEKALREDFDRSSVLERSFACAFDRGGNQLGWQRCADASTVSDTLSNGLRMPFDRHWSPDKRAPALVLASTWVETGYRAAFAPFPLHAISDKTLMSFYSRDRSGDFEVHDASLDRSHKRTLVGAAFVSARFPGIEPAWRIRKPKLWNFVDGGYVDNSGATTALELYQALSKYAEANNLGISLHLILMTDAETNPDLSKVPPGTWFNDTVAPVTALLSVRGQLAGRAVRRAIDSLEPFAKPEQIVGRDSTKQSKVYVVNLQQRTFEFALGWNISNWTDDIVRAMLGAPEFCEVFLSSDLEDRKDRIGHALRTRNDNSCVKKSIQDLLMPKGSTESSGGK